MSSSVIGVGNRYRSDDAIGPIAAERLGGIELRGDGAQLLEALALTETVILIDAVRSGAPAGTIFRFDANERPLPHEIFATSTHALGVAETIALARSLGRLPRRVMVFGVEGRNFDFGTTLSPEVEQAIPELVAQVSSCSVQH